MKGQNGDGIKIFDFPILRLDNVVMYLWSQPINDTNQDALRSLHQFVHNV
jgi:hypothetical protein